jgi:hypothetical protein
MATNSIEKSLFLVPQGVQDTPEMEIEVELVDDDGTPLDPENEAEEVEIEHGDNLAEHIPAQALTKLASDLEAAIDNDLMARSDWEKSYKAGIELLGLHMETRTEPFPGACGVYHPLITEACVRFQAELTTETFPAAGPVRTKILGKETPEKKDAARRVEEDMNHQLTDVMLEYRPEHERMLWNLPMSGSAFKKVYHDDSLGRQVAMFVPAEDIILPYGTTDLGTCNRLTHRFRKTMIDLERLQKSGFYRDVEVQPQQASTNDIQEKKDKEAGNSPINDDRPEFYEVHADLVLKDCCQESDTLPFDDGELTRPYVVTLVKGQSIVLSIRRNWKEEDPLALKRQHFVHYQYVPGFGAYGFGLFHLVGGYARSATSVLRQLIDAGTFANLPGGYKTKGMRIKGEDAPIRPGEFRDVDVGSGTIKDNIMPLPFKEPSVVLAGLLDKLIEDGRRMAATADIKIADMSSQAPVGTTLALLERTLKVMTAVQARCHYVLKQEFGLIAGIIRDNRDDDYAYDPEKGDRSSRKSDFAMVDILPVSDPNAATLSQRVVQYQAALQMAETSPQIYNMPYLHREMLDVLGIKNAAKILPMPEDMKPRDPVTENMLILQNKPVKAFMLQDHEAHMAVHQMMLQDPKIQAAIGQNPQAQLMQGALMAHIAEHAGYAYRMHVSQQLGMPLPDPEEDMNPEVERQIAPLLAQAAQQALMQNQKMAAQQQAQAMQQDPAFQLEQKKLAQKDREIGVKELQVKGTLAVAADKQDLEEARFEAETKTKLADFGLRRAQQDAQISADGIRLGKETAPQPTKPEGGAPK